MLPLEDGSTAGADPDAPSRKFFEMPEAQTADDGLLDGRDVGIDLISTERRAHHRPSGATALRLADELGDGLGDIVRLRSVLTLQHRREGLVNGVGNLADLAVGLRDVAVGRPLDARVQACRVSPRLKFHHIYAELGNLQPNTVGQSFDRHLARAVDAYKGERHPAE